MGPNPYKASEGAWRVLLAALTHILWWATFIGIVVYCCVEIFGRS